MKTFISIFCLLLFTLSLSAQENNQALTQKQTRQMQREQRKKAREQADMNAFNAANQALKNQNWVLMANTIFMPSGNIVSVSNYTNFIQFKENRVYIQLAFYGVPFGPNGLGGITLEGSPSEISMKTDTSGNISYSFNVNGIRLSAYVVVNIGYGNNYAQATVYPTFNGRNITFSGLIVPTQNSGIFKGFVSY